MTYTDISELEVIPKDWEQDNSIIKVIGVGGGGCNAVNYMFNKKIDGCTFIVCNTDSQSLKKSPVPTKIQLGSGLGAGCNPTEGRNAALNSQKEIEEKVFDGKTEMLFITAGMGGGTGTGAAPVIAAMAKNKGILTVGVVTLPFKNEGNESLSKAIDGIYELQKNVDSLLIINNEKIYAHYGGLLIQDAFPKTDEVLATAVQGITEIISKPGYVNVDFKDVKAMMTGSGMALMGCGSGQGKNRIADAVNSALASPLLNDFEIKTAKNVLINITAGYTVDDFRITLNATMFADSGTQQTGSGYNSYATFEEKTTTTGSGSPVLIVIANESNSNGYYSADYYDPTAYWVKDNVLYTLRVLGEEVDKETIQATLERILSEI